MLLGTSLSIVDILFMLALIGFALWKTGWIRVVLSVGIIAWGAYAMGFDVKVGGPLVGIGTVLFIMGILNLVGRYKEERTET